MVKSMALFGGILVVLAASMASTNYLVDQEVPNKLFEFIGFIGDLLVLILFLFESQLTSLIPEIIIARIN